MTLKVGVKAPAFSLPDENGEIHSLKDYLGNWVLVYFYPKDDTPGCTKEACEIRDNFPRFEELNIKVFGISKDSVASHKKFSDKYELPFTILSDEEKKTLSDYGVWQKKKMMGREYMGIVRSSYLINPEGKIAKIYERVKPLEHAHEVLADVETFSS